MESANVASRQEAANAAKQPTGSTNGPPRKMATYGQKGVACGWVNNTNL